MYKFFILSGASSAGKTTSLNTLVESGLCEKALKYSEREERGSSDDIIHIDNIYDTSISCDVVYTMYNNKYGINTNHIKEKLKSSHQIAVISDIKSLIELRKIFKNDVVIIYILSDINIENFIADYIEKNKLIVSDKDKERLFYSANIVSNAIERYEWKKFEYFNSQLIKEAQQIIERSDDFIKRYNSLVESTHIYTNNITLFDHLVLNYKDVNRHNQCAEIIKTY